jgi:inorganic pyrophosphatase
MIPLDALSAGKSPPDEINVGIGIRKGSNVKYEIDSETGALFVDRILSIQCHILAIMALFQRLKKMMEIPSMYLHRQMILYY